jgi:polyisoprenoid-binding protein YceI
VKRTSLIAPFILALSIGALAACEEKSSAPQATVTTAQPVASAAAPAASSATSAALAAPAASAAASGVATSVTSYAFASDASKIEWTGAKITGKHDGGFKKFSGTIEIPASGKIEEGKVSVAIDAASLSADPEKLTRHLKSADFFDVEQFTTIKFTSTSVKAGGAAGATHTITGNVDLHGKTKSISFPAKITVAGDTLSATSEFQINRQDFDLKYPGKPDDLIKDNVVVRLDIKAKRGG